MTGGTKETEDTGQARPATANRQHTPPVITVDYEKYAHFLESCDASEEQKREFIEMLWRIIVGFVDLGFGVHPAQQAQKSCGKPEKMAPKTPSTVPDEVDWKSKFLTENFKDANGLKAEPEAEGV